MDDNQASASPRSARASLLHRWDDRSDAVAIKLHAKSSDLGGASLPDVAPADRASIRGSGARSAGRRRVPSGYGADGSCAARRTFVPPPSAGGRVRAGAAAGDHRFHASAPQLARVPVAVTAAIGDHRVRTATSEPSARGNRRAAPPRMSSGSPWPPTKRQPTPAICRNAGKRAQSPGNADAVHVARIKGIRCKRPVSDATAARLKIVVSPVRVPVSPSTKGLENCDFHNSRRPAPNPARRSCGPFGPFQRPSGGLMRSTRRESPRRTPGRSCAPTDDARQRITRLDRRGGTRG